MEELIKTKIEKQCIHNRMSIHRQRYYTVKSTLHLTVHSLFRNVMYERTIAHLPFPFCVVCVLPRGLFFSPRLFLHQPSSFFGVFCKLKFIFSA